mgnify:CR=1 FL=1
MKIKKFNIFLLSLFLICSFISFSQTYTISGYVQEESNGENLIGVSVFDKKTCESLDAEIELFNLDENKSTKLTIGKDFYRTTEREQMIKSKAKMDLDPKTYFIGNKIYYSEGDKYESRELLGGFNYV